MLPIWLKHTQYMMRPFYGKDNISYAATKQHFYKVAFLSQTRKELAFHTLGIGLRANMLSNVVKTGVIIGDATE